MIEVSTSNSDQCSFEESVESAFRWVKYAKIWRGRTDDFSGGYLAVAASHLNRSIELASTTRDYLTCADIYAACGKGQLRHIRTMIEQAIEVHDTVDELVSCGLKYKSSGLMEEAEKTLSRASRQAISIEDKCAAAFGWHKLGNGLRKRGMMKRAMLQASDCQDYIACAHGWWRIGDRYQARETMKHAQSLVNSRTEQKEVAPIGWTGWQHI